MNNSSRKTTVFKLMIGVFVALLLIGFGWSRYSRPDAGSAYSVATDAVEAGGEDQVKSLIVRMYKWKDANLTDGDFMPVTNAEGSKYVGIDFGKHTARLDVLRRTAFFTDELLGSYDDIAKAIDKKLKNGEYLWPAG